MFAEDVSFSYAPLLGEIVALGASHVALVVPLYQTHATSTQLRLHTRFSPTLEAIADTIRDARRAGLEVTVFPIVRLSDPRSPERMARHLGPADPDAWFASYGPDGGDLASLAMLTGATRLVVGSELSSLDGDLERWGKLITFIRAVFSGTLVYSANWDHYQRRTPVRPGRRAGRRRLFQSARAVGRRPMSSPGRAAGERIGREIESDLAKYDKPFVFTEVGYRSRHGATASPWDESLGRHADLRPNSSAGSRPSAWPGPPLASSHARLDGLYIWNWYGYGGPGTTSYTPRASPRPSPLADLEKP
jgi:hypothetical protein